MLPPLNTSRRYSIRKRVLIAFSLLLVVVMGFFLGALIRQRARSRTYAATFVSADFESSTEVTHGYIYKA
jgi:hypothetical protein